MEGKSIWGTLCSVTCIYGPLQDRYIQKLDTNMSSSPHITERARSVLHISNFSISDIKCNDNSL